MRARGQLLYRPHGAQTHQPLALLVLQAGPFSHRLADAILLVGNHALHADVKGGGAAVDLRMGDMPLLDPQHVERLHPVGPAAQRFGARHQLTEQARAIARGHRDLIGMFARKADAEKPPRDAHHLHRVAGHEGPARIVDLLLHEVIDQLARFRPRHGELSPMLGDRGKGHCPFGMQALGHEFEVPHHRARSGGGGGHHVMRLAQPRAGAVIHDMPVLAQHQPIAHAPHLQRAEDVGIDEIQQLGRIRPLDVDLAQGGDIADPHGVAHEAHLPVAGLAPCRLAAARKEARTIPQPRLDHRRAHAAALGVAGGEPFGRKALSLRARAHRGDGDRDIGRAESGDPRLRDAPPGGVRQHRQCRDI